MAADSTDGSPVPAPNTTAGANHTAYGDIDHQELRELEAILARAARCGIDPWRVIVALRVDPRVLADLDGRPISSS